MSVTLQQVQSELGSKQVRDVKFFFNFSAKSDFPSDVKSEAAHLLKKYLDGETTKFTSLNEVTPAI